MRMFLAFFCAGVLVLGVALFFLKSQVLSTANENTSKAAGAVSTSTVSEETSAYKIDASYPVFGIAPVDAKIKETIDAGIADIKSIPPVEQAAKNEFNSTFDSVYKSGDIVSVRLLLSEYSGGAHGLTTAIGINYDIQNNKFLTLDDALAMTGETLQDLSDSAKTSLESDYDLVQFPEGIEPKAENFSTFLIGKDSVRFIFQEYQTEAYAAGMPEFSVPRVK